MVSRIKKLLVLAAFLGGCLLARSAAAGATSGIDVLWGGSWWSAVPIETRSGLTKVHYAGWGSEWDEWVEASRIRNAPPALRSARVGQVVEIEWQGSYWPGEVIEARKGQFKVHYAGWGSEWDEWVTLNRLRKGVATTGRKS